MNILITGAGNIGTTLANVLLANRKLLSIDNLWILKNRIQPWQAVDLGFLRRAGAVICSREQCADCVLLDQVEASVDYVFDCAASGTARMLRQYYDSLPRLIGACAQGSEKGFGVPFMTGVNPAAIRGERFVNVVSCNTHGTASVLQTLAGPRLENLIEGDVVVVRRCEDVGSHQRLVSASVVARHLDPLAGTHHAIDVADLFATVGITPKLASSDVTTPSQLMHAARFDIRLDRALSPADIMEKIAGNPFIATTLKFDSNHIFELGRRYGFQGRIFEHAVIVENNLMVDGNRVRGWMFVAQEGNTVISTIDAFLLQTGFPNREHALTILKSQLLADGW
jgi:glyceraldehyde-3-phosphate dehydrogenase (NAD(P))